MNLERGAARCRLHLRFGASIAETWEGSSSAVWTPLILSEGRFVSRSMDLLMQQTSPQEFDSNKKCYRFVGTFRALEWVAISAIGVAVLASVGEVFTIPLRHDHVAISRVALDQLDIIRHGIRPSHVLVLDRISDTELASSVTATSAMKKDHLWFGHLGMKQPVDGCQAGMQIVGVSPRQKRFPERTHIGIGHGIWLFCSIGTLFDAVVLAASLQGRVMHAIDRPVGHIAQFRMLLPPSLFVGNCFCLPSPETEILDEEVSWPLNSSIFGRRLELRHERFEVDILVSIVTAMHKWTARAEQQIASVRIMIHKCGVFQCCGKLDD